MNHLNFFLCCRARFYLQIRESNFLFHHVVDCFYPHRIFHMEGTHIVFHVTLIFDDSCPQLLLLIFFKIGIIGLIPCF